SYISERNLFQADQLPVAGSPCTLLASGIATFISATMSATSGNASPTTGTNEIRTSYPSPVSMVHSPNLDPSVLAAEESGNIGQAGDDPRQQLRVASSVLQAAYRRIRQVRRSLIELDSRSSDPSNIGPEHSALLLTASPVDEFSSDTDDPMDLQALRSNLAAMDRQSQEYLDRFAPGSGNDDHNQPPGFPRPRRQIHLPSPSSSESPLPPRRSMLESHLARRREILDSDDSATFLGRRVAAREAAAAGPSSRPVEQPQPQADPVFRAVEMERDLIHARALRQQRQALRAQRQQPSITTNVPPHPRAPPRRWRAYRTPAETRQNSGSAQLSILSNFSSVQNLTTPTSAVAQNRPLLFEEPMESRDIVESPVGDRSYFIHRRVNADGDELSQDRAAFTRRMQHRFEVLRAARVPPPVPEPRRRGWARLDADGNEIPSDEERSWSDPVQSIEFKPCIMLGPILLPPSGARADRRAERGVDAAGRSTLDGAAFSNLITRTSVSPDDYPLRETSSPRVRLNSADAGGQRVGFGSVMDSVLSVDSRPRQTHPTTVIDNNLHAAAYGSSVPFVVDPLPIPLSQMMPPKIDKKGNNMGVQLWDSPELQALPTYDQVSLQFLVIPL
ncbi:hypothetical protein FB45DRAFT_915649, partial [Roridomyces roridus]